MLRQLRGNIAAVDRRHDRARQRRGRHGRARERTHRCHADSLARQATPRLLNDLYTAYAAASGNKVDVIDIPNDTYTTSVQTKWSTGERPDILEYWPTSQDMAQLDVAGTWST